MKVLITYPPLLSDKGLPCLSQNRQFQWFNNPSFFYPIVPASTATLLHRSGFEVSWKDAIVEGAGWGDYGRFIAAEKPDVVAMETKTPVVKMHWDIITHMKEMMPGAKFVLMGDHVTAFPEESMKKCPALDYVITGGDYDFSLLGICRHLEKKEKLPAGIWYRKAGKISSTGKFRLEHDLNTLPLIDRELTMARLYDKEYNIKRKPFAYTMAGRDCPYHKCRFCAWPVMFPSFRARSPESLLDEIGMLIEKYHVKEVFDDTGTFPPGAWLEKFCKGMTERGYNKKIRLSCNMRVDYINEKNAALMRKAGFRLLKVGLESGNQKTLDRINKGIKVEQIVKACETAKKAGLEIHLTMIIGYPWETKADAMKTFALAKWLMTSGRADVLQSTVLVPYPGTPLWQEGVEKKWFRFNPREYERYDMREPVFKTQGYDPFEICNMVYGIFTSPKYALKKLAEVRSLSDVKYLALGAKAVLGHKKDFSGRKRE